MTLGDVLEINYIKIPMSGKSKKELIEELVTILFTSGHIKDYQTALHAVLSRESLGSTGLEDGIAIPHAKTSAVDKVLVALGICKQPIDFNSQDGKPTQCIFLVLAPESESNAHIEVLSSIARATSSQIFRRLLVQANTAQEVIELFID